MFKYRKRRKELNRKIAETDEQIQRGLQTEKTFLVQTAIGALQLKRKDFETELKVLEAEQILEKAKEFGIGSVAQQETYNAKIAGVDPRPYFTEENKKIYLKAIRDARKNYWEQWTRLIVPWLALLVSIIAIIISIFAYNKATQQRSISEEKLNSPSHPAPQ